MSKVTKEWADAYCQRLMIENNLSFPFYIGRKKQWGGVDSTSYIRSLADFYPSYKEYDEQTRCVAIMLIVNDGVMKSI